MYGSVQQSAGNRPFICLLICLRAIVDDGPNQLKVAIVTVAENRNAAGSGLS